MENCILPNNYQYDIVIPVGPNDIEQLKKQIVYTKKKYSRV